MKYVRMRRFCSYKDMAILYLSTFFSIIVALAHCSVNNATKTVEEKLTSPNVGIQVQNLFALGCENTADELNFIRNTLENHNRTIQSMLCSLEEIYDIANKTSGDVQSQNALVQELSITIESFNSRLADLDAETEDVIELSKKQETKLQGLVALLKTFIDSDLTNTSVADKGLTCPEGFKEFQGSCFKLYQNYLNWSDASDFCKTKGGFLAEPRTMAENNFLRDMNSAGYEIWMGGSDRKTEGEWIWETDADTVSSGFTNWYPGEPGWRDCMSLHPFNGKWIAGACWAGMAFVCQTFKSLSVF